MKHILEKLISQSQGYLELRYHKRQSYSFLAQKSRVDVAKQSLVAGVGVRALVNGSWGFAATSDLKESAIQKAIEEAQANARVLSSRKKKENQVHLAKGNFARMDFLGDGYNELLKMNAKDKLNEIIQTENKVKNASKYIQSASCKYNEILEEKIIVTSDGASASMKIAQPEFAVTAISEKDGERQSSYKSAGVMGGWQCLISHPALDHVVENTVKSAVDLLSAKYPEGGKKTVILSPSVVGLLCHEAIGHTVEADFVKAGSVAQGKIGQVVGSSLVNMADSGCEKFFGYATGNIPFDDEGIITTNTMIIEKGILTSYLHNRESASEFGVAPTGNARAWLYNDEPLIRMRNTYMLPGTSTLEQMIQATEDGYLVEGAGGGQADSNGEFMFGASQLWRIVNGKKQELLREATLSGVAFDVLKTVDMVSKEFLWDLGSGYCGKGQPAKVDAGGPYVRCKITVGGRS